MARIKAQNLKSSPEGGGAASGKTNTDDLETVFGDLLVNDGFLMFGEVDAEGLAEPAGSLGHVGLAVGWIDVRRL